MYLYLLILLAEGFDFFLHFQLSFIVSHWMQTLLRTFHKGPPKVRTQVAHSSSFLVNDIMNYL